MTDRHAAIRRLIETREENLPEPVRRSEAASGFVNMKRPRTCPDCLANGRTLKGCETCGGSGVVSIGRLERIAAVDALPDDESDRDPYAKSTITPFGFDLTHHDTIRDRDRQIDALEQQLSPPRSEADLIEEANRHPYGWELARRRMYRDFDYAALDRAVEWLRGLFPGAKLRSRFMLGYLDVVLPDPLRAPGVEQPKRVVAPVERSAGDHARELRDEEIRRAVLEEAIPTVEVARTWGISISQVNKIVARAA